MLSCADKAEILKLIADAKEELRKEIWEASNRNHEDKTRMKSGTAITFTTLAENGDIADSAIAEHADLLPAWEAPKHYFIGNLCSYDNMAFRIRQEHDSQSIYPPTIVPSLYERVVEQGQGTHDNPIKYISGIGMALDNELYYTEDDVLYLCFRDTGVPVYNRLDELVGIYVEVSE